MPEIPPWLNVMRTITGVKEAPGDANNPQILGMRDEIKRIWADVPGMAQYCDLYQHDATPWCGLAAAFALSEAGYMPPFGATDTDRFLWAQSFADDPNFIEIGTPRPGAIVVMTRSGGGHVTLYESTEGSSYKCRGGNQSDAINVASYPKSSVIAIMWPKEAPLPPLPPDERPMLERGDSGAEVAEVQRILGIPADGEFGQVTESAVEGFQAACDELDVDGVVGPMTWEALDELDMRKAGAGEPLTQQAIDAIIDIARNSSIASYHWKDRGRAPTGWIAGLACCYAQAVIDHGNGTPSVVTMAQAEHMDPNTDALAYYRKQFQALGMNNGHDGLDTMRHLFVMIMGLGMRESSGRYCEGRDMSASNTSADTAEAGCLQTSWNIRSAHQSIPPLLAAYWSAPCGFLDVFRMGVEPNAGELENYGSGDGAIYQFLSKYAPEFHVRVTGVGMRYLRKHWGPIGRNEVELRADADVMLKQVEDYILAAPPEPEPEPEVATITINVDPPGSARVVVIGGTT